MRAIASGETLHRRLQGRTFVLTWISYASYYATRKNLSVAKSAIDDRLHLGVSWLAAIDTAFLAAYALGQFVNGALGDRVGARRMIATGMLASAAASAVFGISSTPTVLLLVFGVNGIFQSTGWPNNVKAMGYWFDRGVRARVMGIWSTNYQVGGLAATAFAAFLLGRFGWRSTFLVPALWVAGVGVAVGALLVEKPADRGLPPADEGVMPAPAIARPRRTPFGTIVRTPEVWILGGAYFGLKLIRYSLLFWLPFYLNRRLGYSASSAGYLSTTFEAGGILGAVVVGWIADRFVREYPMRLVIPLLLGLAASFLAVRAVGTLGTWAVGAALATTGFLLFGPDTLISGMAAQNLGRGGATASAAGIINGFGSVGAACQGAITAGISARWGWPTLFHVFVGLALLSALTLAPLARPRPHGGGEVVGWRGG